MRRYLLTGTLDRIPASLHHQVSLALPPAPREEDVLVVWGGRRLEAAVRSVWGGEVQRYEASDEGPDLLTLEEVVETLGPDGIVCIVTTERIPATARRLAALCLASGVPGRVSILRLSPDGEPETLNPSSLVRVRDLMGEDAS